jgi:hypothetical protein
MDPSPDPADEFRNWLALPRDVTASILMRQEAFDILTSAQMVCSLWHNLCKDPSMGRAIHMSNPVTLWDCPYDLEKMCRHTVDRSCGQLVDINVENFGTDELLRHISFRLIAKTLVLTSHLILDMIFSSVHGVLPWSKDRLCAFLSTFGFLGVFSQMKGTVPAFLTGLDFTLIFSPSLSLSLSLSACIFDLGFFGYDVLGWG